MVKLKRIDSFFKPKGTCSNDVPPQSSDEPMEPPTPISHDQSSHEDEPPLKYARLEEVGIPKLGMLDKNQLIRDPGLRPPISEYSVNERDEIRQTYIKLGPYQFHKDEYPFSGLIFQRRRFQKAWFKRFCWLEYSDVKDSAFCFPCYLFPQNPSGRKGSNTFTVIGFNNWKKVNKGKDCAFINYEGKTHCSSHNSSVRCYENFKNQAGHIENAMEKQTTQQIANKRLRLKTSIEAIKWLTFQACAFRGHDEKDDSRNQGNFLELLKLLASYNKEVDEVVLGKAPLYAKYTSSDIQKEILHVIAVNVQEFICREIGNAKFCLIVDEARDE